MIEKIPEIISVNPFRCRMWDLHDRLDHLIVEDTCRAEIASFEKHGQLIPVVGRPLRDDPEHDIELVFGARRLFVARHLNMPLRVELRSMTDQAALIAMDIENRQRRDISPYERGLTFARCLRSGCFGSQDELAKALKISQSQVSRLLTLAHLPSVVVNAFESPRDIREGWGTDLMMALQTTQRRQATIARARSVASISPRPPAIEIFQQLISCAVPGRKIRAKSHDEVVTGSDGAALFRIRIQGKNVALLLPIDRVSAQTLHNVRDLLRDALQQKMAQRAIPPAAIEPAVLAPRKPDVSLCGTLVATFDAEDQVPARLKASGQYSSQGHSKARKKDQAAV
jgi:ParB family chromosome partitioning protein